MRKGGGWALSALVAACIVGACVGDDPSSSSPSDGGQGSDGGSGGDGTTTGTIPNHAPQAVSFSDLDPTLNSAVGTVIITRANDESDLDGYALYYGTSPTDKLTLTPITVLAKSGSNLKYSLSVSPLPAGATTLLAFSTNAVGELSAGPSTPFHDGVPAYVDFTAGVGPGTGFKPSIIVDDAAQKLLMVVTELPKDGSVSPNPALYRCDLDGTSCTRSDISVGGQLQFGDSIPPTLAIDKSAGKLDVVFEGPELVRCNLDGTSCAFADVYGEADAGVQFGQTPTIAIDTTNGKLLIAIDDFNSDRTAIYRSNLDGTGGQHIDISVDAGVRSGFSPAIAIDHTNNKLLVATDNNNKADRPALFICNLDGTACTWSDISANQVGSSGLTPAIAVDEVNGKVLVATDNNSSTMNKLGLFRCNLDGSGCAYTDISAGQGAGCGTTPSIAIDTVNAKVLVVTQDNSNGGRPTLFRCNLDGSACAHFDFSAGAGANSAYFPRITLNPTTSQFFIAAENDSTAPTKPALFLMH